MSEGGIAPEAAIQKAKPIENITQTTVAERQDGQPKPTTPEQNEPTTTELSNRFVLFKHLHTAEKKHTNIFEKGVLAGGVAAALALELSTRTGHISPDDAHSLITNIGTAAIAFGTLPKVALETRIGKIIASALGHDIREQKPTT